MRHTFYLGNTLDVLRTLPGESVHCVVTSPPYWGLRDYGVPGQIGLEATPDEYVAKMVEVFREVRRVLRGDGTLWLNLGDCFNAKNLVGIPWRVAFALQADGWWLRSDIIWRKPNPMPESVTDRPTKSHEYLFLLTKSARYYYDAVAIQEPQVCPQDSTPEDLARAHNRRRQAQVEPRQDLIQPSALSKSTFRREHAKHSEPNPGQSMAMFRPDRADTYPTGYRNKRDVWTVATQPFPGAHFAVMPEALVEPCILAGCPEGGTVLDPFGGSGTVSIVSRRLGRSSVYIDLNPSYADMAVKRLGAEQQGLFEPCEVRREVIA